MTTTHKTAGLAILFFLVILAGSELLVRGPLFTNTADLASPYVSAVRFIHDENPYPSKNFLANWHDAGALRNMTVDKSDQHPIYPPTALFILAPLAELPWTWAAHGYVWACTFGYLGLVWLLSRLVANRWSSWRRLGFIAFALALSPIHTAIHYGNPSIMVFLLCGYALYSARHRDSTTSGILIALGFCVKPTTALAAVVIVLLYGRIRSVLSFLGASASIVGCTVILMNHIGPLWWADYRYNLSFMFGPEGAANFATQDSGHFDMVNLQVPFYSVFQDVLDANLVAWAISTALAIVWLSLFLRVRNCKPDTYRICVGSMSLLVLLPIYQRNYNAGVILFVMLWAFDDLQEPLAKAALLVSGLFLIPGEAILRRIGLEDRFLGSVLWNMLAMSQLTWAIVAVVVISFLAMWRCAVHNPYPPMTQLPRTSGFPPSPTKEVC